MKKILKFIAILVLTMGFVLGTEFLTSSIISGVLGISGAEAATNPQALAVITKYQIIFGQLLRLCLIFLFFYIRKKKNNRKDISIKYKGLLPDSWKMIVIGLGVAGLGNYVISFLLAVIGHIPSVSNTLEQFNDAFQMSGGLDFLLMIIGAVILAPISEEILFRGLVFERLRKIYTLPWAIVLSGLIFGIYHMNILQGINTFIMGSVLAYVYYYRRNIMDSILIHIVNNFFALTVGLNQTLAIVMTVVSTIAIFISIKYLKDFKVKSKTACDVF